MVAADTRTDQAKLLVEQGLSFMVQDNLSQADATAEVLRQNTVEESTLPKLVYHGLYALMSIALGTDRRKQGLETEPETNGTARSGGGRGARRSATITYIEAVLGDARYACPDGGSRTLREFSEADLLFLRSQFAATVTGVQRKIYWIDKAITMLVQHRAGTIIALPVQVQEDLAVQKAEAWKVAASN
jgi:hypothetical protein